MFVGGDHFEPPVERDAHGVVEERVAAFELDLLPSFFERTFDEVERGCFGAHLLRFDEVTVVDEHADQPAMKVDRDRYGRVRAFQWSSAVGWLCLRGLPFGMTMHRVPCRSFLLFRVGRDSGWFGSRLRCRAG